MFVGQYWKKLMEYRADFLIGLLGFFLFQATGIAFLYLVFQRIPSLNGWSFEQVLFIYGFAQIPRGLDHLLTDNLWMLSNRIIANGEFDRYLLRPANPLFQLIAEVFQPDALGELIVGFGLVIYAALGLGLSFGVLEILIFTALIITGTVIYTSIKLVFASMAFWLKKTQSILFLVYTLGDFAKYPIGIYHPVIRVLISAIIPFAFTAYYPAAWFLGQETLLLALGGSALAAVLIFTLGYTVWNKGISAYESSGS